MIAFIRHHQIEKQAAIARSSESVLLIYVSKRSALLAGENQRVLLAYCLVMRRQLLY